MELEQEGIDIETLNSDGIVLPDMEDEGVENEEIDETEVETPETDEQGNDEDDEKKSLQDGINAERRKRKEAEKKAKKLEAEIQALKEKGSKPEKSALDTLIESGIDETVAKSVMKAIDSNKTDTSKLEKELADIRFERDLTAKSREEGFDDILDYADEIKDLVDKGLTIEQSYYATVGTKARTKDTKSEIERKLEAKMQNNATRKEILGGLSSNAGTSVNSNGASIKATPEEKALAVAAGMTIEEYVALRDMGTTKEYENYKNRKKK